MSCAHLQLFLNLKTCSIFVPRWAWPGFQIVNLVLNHLESLWKSLINQACLWLAKAPPSKSASIQRKTMFMTHTRGGSSSQATYQSCRLIYLHTSHISNKNCNDGGNKTMKEWEIGQYYYEYCMLIISYYCLFIYVFAPHWSKVISLEVVWKLDPSTHQIHPRGLKATRPVHLPGVVCKPQTPGSYHVLPMSVQFVVFIHGCLPKQVRSTKKRSLSSSTKVLNRGLSAGFLSDFHQDIPFFLFV